MVKKSRHVERRHKNKKSFSLPTFEANKKSLGLQMRHVNGTRKTIKKRDSRHTFKVKKNP